MGIHLNVFLSIVCIFSVLISCDNISIQKDENTAKYLKINYRYDTKNLKSCHQYRHSLLLCSIPNIVKNKDQLINQFKETKDVHYGQEALHRNLVRKKILLDIFFVG